MTFALIVVLVYAAFAVPLALAVGRALALSDPDSEASRRLSARRVEGSVEDPSL